MSKPVIYIDGKDGTTGLQIYERIGKRDDLELITISEELRKDVSERKKMINSADIVFLCLPDDAARQAVTLLENPATKIIDASTAHRTAQGWTYGFPELCREQRDNIRKARLVANPGCHATGAVSILAPLVASGILPKDYPVSITSLTGYSGGGNKMIAQYDDSGRDEAFNSPRIYGLTLAHKHLPEILYYTKLDRKPGFVPIVSDYYNGMATMVLLEKSLLGEGNVYETLAKHYEGETFVKVERVEDAQLQMSGYIESNAHVGTNKLEMIVCESADQVLCVSRFDNLGKGASGAAVQNMNIMLGLEETKGLK